MDSPGNSDAPDTNGTSPLGRRPKTAVLRATFCYALPIAIMVALIGACSGLIPPWPVAIVILIGLFATVSLIATRRPAIGATSAVVAILVSAWLLRPVVDIRAAEPNDRIYERYFGIDPYDDTAGDVIVKNIVIATGTFTLDTWMSASLYHVKSGEIHELNAFTVGRSPNQLGAPHWVDMRITLALGDRHGPEGRTTQLGIAGQSRGGGRGRVRVNDVQSDATETLPGQLTSGTKRIVYVEGDKGFNVDHTMTVEHFAQENSGNYLVIEVELH